eukprot:SM000014S00380  [mRNA]  locus=s14:1059224:1067046:+ [translate_table: standard]
MTTPAPIGGWEHSARGSEIASRSPTAAMAASSSCPAGATLVNRTCICPPGFFAPASGGGGACAGFRPQEDGQYASETSASGFTPNFTIRTLDDSTHVQNVFLIFTLSLLGAWTLACLYLRFKPFTGVWFRLRWIVSRIDVAFAKRHYTDEQKCQVKRKTELGGMLSIGAYIFLVGISLGFFYQFVTKKTVTVQNLLPTNGNDIINIKNTLDYNLTTIGNLKCSQIQGFNSLTGLVATAVGFEFSLRISGNKKKKKRSSYATGQLQGGSNGTIAPNATLRGPQSNVIGLSLVPRKFKSDHDLMLMQVTFHEFTSGSYSTTTAELQAALANRTGVSIAISTEVLSAYLVETDHQASFGILTLLSRIGGIYSLAMIIFYWFLSMSEIFIKYLRYDDKLLNRLEARRIARARWDKIRLYVRYAQFGRMLRTMQGPPPLSSGLDGAEPMTETVGSMPHPHRTLPPMAVPKTKRRFGLSTWYQIKKLEKHVSAQVAKEEEAAYQKKVMEEEAGGAADLEEGQDVAAPMPIKAGEIHKSRARHPAAHPPDLIRIPSEPAPGLHDSELSLNGDTEDTAKPHLDRTVSEEQELIQQQHETFGKKVLHGLTEPVHLFQQFSGQLSHLRPPHVNLPGLLPDPVGPKRPKKKRKIPKRDERLGSASEHRGMIVRTYKKPSWLVNAELLPSVPEPPADSESDDEKEPDTIALYNYMQDMYDYHERLRGDFLAMQSMLENVRPAQGLEQALRLRMPAAQDLLGDGDALAQQRLRLLVALLLVVKLRELCQSAGQLEVARRAGDGNGPMDAQGRLEQLLYLSPPQVADAHEQVGIVTVRARCEAVLAPELGFADLHHLAEQVLCLHEAGLAEMLEHIGEAVERKRSDGVADTEGGLGDAPRVARLRFGLGKTALRCQRGRQCGEADADLRAAWAEQLLTDGQALARVLLRLRMPADCLEHDCQQNQRRGTEQPALF